MLLNISVHTSGGCAAVCAVEEAAGAPAGAVGGAVGEAMGALVGAAAEVVLLESSSLGCAEGAGLAGSLAPPTSAP